MKEDDELAGLSERSLTPPASAAQSGNGHERRHDTDLDGVCFGPNPTAAIAAEPAREVSSARAGRTPYVTLENLNRATAQGKKGVPMLRRSGGGGAASGAGRQSARLHSTTRPTVVKHGAANGAGHTAKNGSTGGKNGAAGAKNGAKATGAKNGSVAKNGKAPKKVVEDERDDLVLPPPVRSDLPLGDGLYREVAASVLETFRPAGVIHVDHIMLMALRVIEGEPAKSLNDYGVAALQEVVARAQNTETLVTGRLLRAAATKAYEKLVRSAWRCVRDDSARRIGDDPEEVDEQISKRVVERIGRKIGSLNKKSRSNSREYEIYTWTCRKRKLYALVEKEHTAVRLHLIMDQSIFLRWLGGKDCCPGSTSARHFAQPDHDPSMDLFESHAY